MARVFARSVGLLWAGSLCWVSSAQAYEDQLTLGAAAGYGAAVSDVVGRDTAVFDLAATIGLTPSVSARLRVSYALHPQVSDAAATHAFIPGGALLYLIDVLEWVPYFGIGPSARFRFQDGDVTSDALAQAIVGVDYLASRDLTFELELRTHVALTALEDDPLLFTATLGAVLMFDR